MPVTIIIKLVAHDPAVTLKVLSAALPVTRQFSGNRSSHTFMSQDQPHEIVLIQEWDTRVDQEKYIAWRQSTGDLAQLLETLRQAPVTEYLEFNPA